MSGIAQRMTWVRLTVFGLVAVVILQGCAVSGLSFVKDERVDIVEPKQNASVELPLEVQWTVRDFDGSFVVFFTRAPMRPNRSLRSIVPEDDPCFAQPDCPDEDWLRDRHIYVVSGTRLVVETLPDLRAGRTSRDRHELTIVLLDDNGRRVGESAFIREFIVERED